MKTEDFERLKEICEREGFDVLESPFDHGIFKIGTKKDPWQDVEFVKSLFSGKIYHKKEINPEKGNFIKSTESEYFEQLKKEAFEKYGEIKEGDRFERSWRDNQKIGIIKTGRSFVYYKDTDNLNFGGISIYKSGKWAVKLPERVKVEYIKSSKINLMSNFTFKIKGVSGYNPNIIGDFLAKQLENYLNDNQE